MWMAFNETRVRDTSEACFCTKVFQRRRTCITHARTQAANKLIYVFSKAALIRHATFDPLGDKFSASVLTRCIAIDTVALQRSETSHAAVFLEAPALVEHHFTRCFIQPRQQAAEHDRIPASDKRLNN